MEDTFLKVADLAKAIDVSVSTGYRILSKGEIPFSKFGRLIKIKRADIEKFIENAEVKR